MRYSTVEVKIDRAEGLATITIWAPTAPAHVAALRRGGAWTGCCARARTRRRDPASAPE